MGWLGPREVLLIVVLIVLLFGARRIPELMRSIGSGLREFKQGIQGDDEKPDGDKEPGRRIEREQQGNRKE